MLNLIIGGSASGKSEYAERLVCSLHGKRIYAATMEPFGEEGRERIVRHRKLREGKGFVTVEVPRDLGVFADELWKSRTQGEVFGKVPDTETALENPDTKAARETCNILLEDLPNLVANELFADGEIVGTDAERVEKSDKIFSKVIREIEELSCISENLTIVTGDIFSDGGRYDSVTEEYRSLLAKMNRRIAEKADQVVFVTAGCPIAADTGNTDSSPAGETDSECGDTFFCVKDTGKETAAVDLRQKPSYSENHSERKSGMVFVTGPLASGKRAWVQKNLEISGGNFVRAAELPREHSGGGVLQKDYARESRDSDEAGQEDGVRDPDKAAREDDVRESQYPGFPHPERICVTDVQELVGKRIMTEEELAALADRLAVFRAVTACEVGGGVIPLDRGERIWRENAGRLACLLAERADQVILVHCGIGICIKPA